MTDSDTQLSGKIRILFLIDHLGVGGAQVLMVELVKRLDPERFQVEVAALYHGDHYRGALAQCGIPVHVLCDRPFSINRLPLYGWRLRKMIKSEPYDVVHTWLQASFIVGTLVARFSRISTIHSVMANKAQVQRWYFPLMSRLQRWVAIFVAAADPNELRENGVQSERIKRVEAAVQLDSLRDIIHDPRVVVAPCDLDGAFPVVLSVGRLHPDKGHEYAIRAWSEVLRKYPDARLLIVGDGEDEARLKAITRAANVERTVLFLGYRSDLITLFRRADICVRASINEGVNMVTVQAMAAGLPVIGFETKSTKEYLINNVSGLLVTLADTASLSDAILVLAADQDFRVNMGQSARAGVLDYYDLSRVTTCYARMYVGLRDNVPVRQISDMTNEMWPVRKPVFK